MGALWFWRKRSIGKPCIFGPESAEFEKGPRLKNSNIDLGKPAAEVSQT